MNGALFVIGATHHQAPIAVREKLALPGEAAGRLQQELIALPEVRELALLNTCNRVEFYGVAAHPTATGRIQAAFCRQQHFDVTEFERFRLDLSGRSALLHLLEVAAGLDSQMVGETEIFGQVKEAYAAAQAQRGAGPVLNRVFQKVFQAAKHVRTHTAINLGQVSVANVAVELARNIFGNLTTAQVLLLGAGEIGEKTARAFLNRGAGTLTVASRRMDRAMELAAQLGARALPFDQRESRLGEFDIVVCATSSPEPVLGAGLVAAAMKKRPTRPLLLIDLSLPRNVDEGAGRLQNVFVYNLDDLAKIADENRRAREAEITKCRRILSDRADALWPQVEVQLRSSNGIPKPSAG